MLDDLVKPQRSYVRTFGKHPTRLVISEAIDDKLCSEMEAIGQWTPYSKGLGPRSMHGGSIHGVRVEVVPAIEMAADWEVHDA